MTEDEKAREVKRILAVADYAENTGLIATAKNWRDYAMNIAARPARSCSPIRPANSTATGFRMANVPYGEGVPEVSPREDVPDDLQHIQANPNEFGGLIAEGAEKAGQGLEQAGENAFNIEQFRGKINVDDQVNHWITTSNKILYGDPDKTTLDLTANPFQ